MSRRGAVAPLALAAAPHASAFESRFEVDAVDALPYADVLPEGWRDAAEAAVRDEMRRGTARLEDYEAQVPPSKPLTFKPITALLPALTASSAQGCPLIGADVARAAGGTPLPPPDASRLHLEPPPGTAASDVGAWAAAVANAKAQLEHQALRIQNLELLTKYGASAWLAHTRAVEAALASGKAQLAALEAATAELHKTRKVQQQAAGAELAAVERQWRAAVAKCAEVEAACVALEAQAPQNGDAHAMEQA